MLRLPEDFAPCDFIFVIGTQNKLEGTNFQMEKPLSCAVSEGLDSVSENSIFNLSEQQLDRCKKSVELDGEYIEKFWGMTSDKFFLLKKM
jgi:hypothetical protein